MAQVGSADVPAPAPLARERGWSPRLILSLISLVVLLEALTMSYSMISTGLPDIMAHFRTDQGGWSRPRSSWLLR